MRSNYDDRPIHCACGCSHAAAVAALLAHGDECGLTVRNADGKTPLEIAMTTQRGKPAERAATVRVLLAAGAIGSLEVEEVEAVLLTASCSEAWAELSGCADFLASKGASIVARAPLRRLLCPAAKSAAVNPKMLKTLNLKPPGRWAALWRRWCGTPWRRGRARRRP